MVKGPNTACHCKSLVSMNMCICSLFESHSIAFHHVVMGFFTMEKCSELAVTEIWLQTRVGMKQPEITSVCCCLNSTIWRLLLSTNCLNSDHCLKNLMPGVQPVMPGVQPVMPGVQPVLAISKQGAVLHAHTLKGGQGCLMYPLPEISGLSFDSPFLSPLVFLPGPLALSIF